MNPYMLTKVVRRIFVVPIANDRHGKSTLMKNFVNHSSRSTLLRVQHGARLLWTPNGRSIDSYIFVRSYQETLKNGYPSVSAALIASDTAWKRRELVILPSHVDSGDCEQIIETAHGAGFDIIAVPVLLEWNELDQFTSCLELAWDQRWTILNAKADDWRRQSQLLAADLWARLSIAFLQP